MLQQVTTLGLTHFPIPQGKATKLATNDYIRDKLTASGHGHVSVLGESLEDSDNFMKKETLLLQERLLLVPVLVSQMSSSQTPLKC